MDRFWTAIWVFLGVCAALVLLSVMATLVASEVGLWRVMLRG